MKLATEIDFKLNNGKTIPALGLGTVASKDPKDVKDQVITAVKMQDIVILILLGFMVLKNILVKHYKNYLLKELLKEKIYLSRQNFGHHIGLIQKNL